MGEIVFLKSPESLRGWDIPGVFSNATISN